MPTIVNGGTAAITMSGEVCSSLYLGGGGNGNSTVQMSNGGLLVAGNTYIGVGNTGTFIQYGGTNTLSSGSLDLGYNSGSSGIYNLSGSGALWAVNEYVGYSGSGAFTQSGGTNTSIGLNLGYNPGSSGSYTLSGSGLLSSYGETVGGLGSGTLAQSGGTNNVGGYSGLYVGFGAGSSGLYNLSGSAALSAASEYMGYSGTGTFTQSGGTNTVAGVFSLGGAGSGTYNLTAGALIVPGIQGAGGVFNLGGGTLVASAAFSASQAMTLTGSGGKGNINTGGYAVTLSGVLSGSGGLNVLGQGNLTLAGGNTYSGGTTILAGTLSLNNASALQNSTVTVSASNTLLFNSNSGAIATFNVGGLTGSGSIGLADGNYPVTLNVGGNGAGTTYSGVLAGPGSLVKIGAGLLTLSGSNGYTGGTTVSAGTLQVGSGGSGASIGGTSGVLDNGSLIFNHADGVTFPQIISGSGSLTQTGAGILTLLGSNTYSGGTTISAGTLQVGNGGSGASIGTTSSVLNNGNLIFNHGDAVVFPQVISGSGGLTQAGAGLLTLLGSNTYSGGTTIAAGTLKLDFSQAGAPTANIINNLANSSSLALGGGTLAIQGKLGTTNSQQFNGLTVNPGSSAIVLTASTSNPLLLSLGGISRNAGGTVDFTLPSGTQSASNGITTSTPNTAAGILGGYATVSGTSWATNSGGNIIAYSATSSNYASGNLGVMTSNSALNVSPSGADPRRFRGYVLHAEPGWFPGREHDRFGFATTCRRRPDRQYVRQHQRRHLGGLGRRRVGRHYARQPHDRQRHRQQWRGYGADQGRLGHADAHRQQHLQRRNHGRRRHAPGGQRRQRRLDRRHQRRAGQRQPRFQPRRRGDVFPDHQRRRQPDADGRGPSHLAGRQHLHGRHDDLRRHAPGGQRHKRRVSQ